MINTKHPPKDTLLPATAFALIYIAWAYLVTNATSFIHHFDKNVINFICNSNHANAAFAKSFTNLGNTSTITALTIILFIILLILRQYAYAWFTAGTMAAANGYNWLMKHAVMRPRPTVHHLVTASGYSFPSGHSVGSAALAGILILLIILLLKNHISKALLIILCLSFPVLIGYTRIFTHVHYPSDVLGGWLEGITFVLLGYSFLYHFYIEPHLPPQQKNAK